MNYYEGSCYLNSEGEKRTFRNELELEKFVARCPHTQTYLKGRYIYCRRCYALPRLR